jgi:hypothetical protein
MNHGVNTNLESIFDEARDRGHYAVRQWYPNYVTFSVMPDFVPGANLLAIVSARAGAAADLAAALDRIKRRGEARQISYEQAVQEARPQVGTTARMLWRTAQFVLNPLAPLLTAQEEFENYRLVAVFLAMDLAQLAGACYYAGIWQPDYAQTAYAQPVAMRAIPPVPPAPGMPPMSTSLPETAGRPALPPGMEAEAAGQNPAAAR